MEAENQMGRLQTAAFTVLNGDFSVSINFICSVWGFGKR